MNKTPTIQIKQNGEWFSFNFIQRYETLKINLWEEVTTKKRFAILDDGHYWVCNKENFNNSRAKACKVTDVQARVSGRPFLKEIISDFFIKEDVDEYFNNEKKTWV